MNKKSSSEPSTHFEFTIDRFEGEKVVLLMGEEEIIAPKIILPKVAKEGDVVIGIFKTEESTRLEREKKAKELLNEILRA